jgi:hypothetical protein
MRRVVGMDLPTWQPARNGTKTTAANATRNRMDTPISSPTTRRERGTAEKSA